MDTLFSPELFWVLAGIVMLFLELFVPGLVIIFFGGGALLTALATALGLTRSLAAQLLLFIVSSLLLLALLRRFFRKIFIGKLFENQVDPSFDVEVGCVVDVREEIVPDSNRGKVFYQGAQWAARCRDAIPAGGRARVAGRDNITLLVEKINLEE